MARLDTRPKTTSMTPKVVNISPMGSRRSSFIVESPEDHVEHRGERQHHHTKCGRALVPSGFVVRDAGGERIHQPLEVLVRLVARVRYEITMVQMKHALQAKIAVQKFCAISLG